MAFPFVYQEITRKPNPMKNINPLARTSGKRVTLVDRVLQLESSNKWQKTVRRHKDDGTTFNLALIPKIGYVKLGKSIIDEDIQRTLDEAHCANKIGGERFNPRYLAPMICILTSAGEYISIDAQHSTTTVAALISAGLFVDAAGNTVEDWREIEYPTVYVETDDLSFARKAFGILNGKGKLRQSKYNELRNSVFCVRIDKNTDDEEDVTAERKVSIAEKHNCYPVEQASALTKYPSTFTHISLFNLASEETLEAAFSWHDKFFHQDTVHASLFPLFRDIVRDFKTARILVTDTLLVEMAAMIQGLFGDLEEFGQSAMQAQRQYSVQRYGYEQNWSDDMYAVAFFQLYSKLGGSQQVPMPLLDKYFDPKTNTGFADFFAAEILELAQAA